MRYEPALSVSSACNCQYTDPMSVCLSTQAALHERVSVDCRQALKASTPAGLGVCLALLASTPAGLGVCLALLASTRVFCVCACLLVASASAVGSSAADRGQAVMSLMQFASPIRRKGLGQPRPERG